MSEDGHPHIHKTGHSKLDMFVAVCALVVSLISLAVAIHHGKIQERLVAANTWPYMVMESTNNARDNEVRIGLYLVNGGVGPARVETFELKLDGKVIRDPVQLVVEGAEVDLDVLKSQIAEVSKTNPMAVLSGSVAGTVVRPGAKAVFFEWSKADVYAEPWAKLDRKRQQGKFTATACYCSVFDECWVTNFEKEKPKQVDACPKQAPETEYRG